MPRVLVHFFGKVQGVGFRAKTQKKALEKDLNGSVENLPNGSVKAILEGPMASIFSLVEYLSSSFILCKIEISFEEERNLKGFSIL